MNSKRYLRKISHNYVVVINFPPSFWSQAFFSSKQGYSYLKFKGGNVDRNGIYSSLTEIFSNAILFVYPLRGAVAKMLARHGSICTNKSTFDYFDGTNPISGQGTPLRSPTPIMAPGPLMNITIAKAFVFSSIFFCIFSGALTSSRILGSLDRKYSDKLNSYLDPVLQSPGRSRFVRCWHAKTDGWAASTFHSNCDGKGPTVTIVQVGSYIFGGYTDKSWGGEYLIS